VSKGSDAVLEIDVQGGASVKAAIPEAVRIGILPPDWETLRARLTRGAGQPAGDRTASRGGPARDQGTGNYDYLVVNDDWKPRSGRWSGSCARGGFAGNVRSAPSAGS